VTWSGIYLDNPAGRLPLPSMSLGDAPVGFGALSATPPDRMTAPPSA
jgi:hypothetical protein